LFFHLGNLGRAGVGTGSRCQCSYHNPQQAPLPEHSIDTGSTAWMLTSSAFVLFMVPGLALFYSGMVRAKNVLNMFLSVMVLFSCR
jgi:hypothetical protein